MKYFQKFCSFVFSQSLTGLGRRIFNPHAFLTVFVVSTLIFAIHSSVQAQKLKNAIGSVLINGNTDPIDSIFYIPAIPFGTGGDYYLAYFTDGGTSFQNELCLPVNFPGNDTDKGALCFGGNVTYVTSVISGSAVTITYKDSKAVTQASFSYNRYKLQLQLASQSQSDSAQSCFQTSNVPPTPQTGFSFHYVLDGKMSDSLVFNTFTSDLVLSAKTFNSKGKQVDSLDLSKFNYDLSPSDTTVYCPAVPTWDSYLEKVFVGSDPFIAVPDTTGVSFNFIVNQGVYQSKCKNLPWLSFDATQANVPDSLQYPSQTGLGWKGGAGIGVIQDSGTVFINNILRFHGIMKIDTINSLIDANGEYYVWTQGGFVLNPLLFKLGTGIWPKFSYSCNGLVSIAQNILSSDGLGGFSFSIDSIYFFTDSTGVNGVRLGATVKIPNINASEECGSPSSKISISPIEITSNGIGGAIHVSNVAIGPLLCIKDLFGAYYSQPDSLAFGGALIAPFADELALSAGWKQGLWDAVAFNYQQQTGGVPIGNTGMLLSGVRGSASGWNNPPLKCSFGGTFDDVVPNFMRWEGDLSYQEPSTLKGSLTLKFLNVINWQAVMNATAEVDWNHYVKFSGSLQEGTLGNGYVFNGKGDLTYTWSPVSDLIGSGSGLYSIPKLFPNGLSAITDYINSLLPIQLANAEMSLKSGVVMGNISLPTIIGPLSGHIAVNLNLPSNDPNFINFGRGTIPLSIVHPMGKDQITSLPLDSVTLPANTAFAVIRIRSNGKPSASTLIDPSNKSHTNAPGDTLVGYAVDSSTNHGFWVLRNPAVGIWILSMPARTATDTVDAEAEPVEDPLQFTATEVGKHVTLNWTPLPTGDSADVTAYLDDSSGGYTGFLYATANDTPGTLSFDLNDSLPACQYYLYAARDNGAYISKSYSSLQLDNSKSSALPPTNLTMKYLGGDSILLTWTPTSSIGLSGYAIMVTDENGVDSIYGCDDVTVDSAVIVVQNPNSKRISLDAYGDGLQSCWSQSISAASLVATPNAAPTVPTIALQVWPNPSTGKGELSFNVSDRDMVRVTIFNLLGQEIVSPVQGVFEAGSHSSSFDLSSFPPGIYYCRIQSDGIVQTRKLVIEH